MAGDWIKMRASLVDHPKVIAVARLLSKSREFRDWLTPGGGGPMNGPIVSTAASRAVTVASLMRVWSTAREHGKFVGDDLHLAVSAVEDLDEFAGAPGVGEAMLAVGWVEEREGKPGIFLPRFKEFNVPMSDAQRSQKYRDRKAAGVTDQPNPVTQPSRSGRDGNSKNVTPRERVVTTTGVSEANASSTPEAVASKAAIWKAGKAILVDEGLTVEKAGSLIGALVRDYGQKRVLAVLQDCAKVAPAKPSEWIVAACQERLAAGNGAWLTTRAGVEKRARELGVSGKPGEEFPEFQRRVIEANANRMRSAA